MNNFAKKSRVAAAALGLTIGAAALLAPSASAYSGASGYCRGASIIGGGASFQNALQLAEGADKLNIATFVLGSTPFSTLPLQTAATAGFGHAGAATGGCATSNWLGTGKTISYAGTGSGGGRNSWAANGTTPRDPSLNFVGTDEPSSPAEEANEETIGLSAPTTMETIPVAQGATALIVNLPAGCALANKDTRRATLSAIERHFYGGASTWGSLLGNFALTPSTCATIKATRIVRKDSSGTTFAFKKTLDVFSPTNRWSTGATNYLDPTNNVNWPSTVVKPANTGGGAVADLVSATASSIGYVDLATARAKGFGFDQPGGALDLSDTKFWLAVIANNTSTTTVVNEPGKDRRSVPITPGANCSSATTGRDYSPPADTQANWFNVTGAKAFYNLGEYPFCTLTYVQAYDKYSNVLPNATTGISTTEPHARTVYDYAKFLTGNGQSLLQFADYQALPTVGPSPLRPIAAAGANRIDW